MLEIKIAGRGGQGVVLASQLIAEALYRQGFFVQSFPSFGAERRGAPVSAFVRADSETITWRCAVQRPDWLIVFSSNLLDNPQITDGIGPSTGLVLNSRHIPPNPLETDKIFLVDASGIARESGLMTGSFPMVNTAMVGAFAKAQGQIDIETVARVVLELAPIKKEQNEMAARKAFEKVQEIYCD